MALLVGFVAAGGPAFADGGYDLKAGWELRGKGRDIAFELAGRRQQLYAGLIGMAVALIVVAMSHDIFFANNLFPPIDRVYVATIKAGVEPGVITNLLLWALPGAAIQLAGGPNRQMGILLATGLLISSPLAGWAVLAGLVIRLVILRFKGAEAVTPMTIMAAGVIAGDALYSFGSSIGQAVWRR